MRKEILMIMISIFISGATIAQQKTLYDFKVTSIEGEEYALSQLKGKKVMVVNTASKCGLTPQYEALEKLYKEYGNEKFTIIGFPANNFLSQEPGTDEEIKEFCTKNYGVSFPMMSKISVKGDDIHPLYQWLTKKTQNGVVYADVSWNFQKFLIDEDGKVVKAISPRQKPDSEEIISWITGK